MLPSFINPPSGHRQNTTEPIDVRRERDQELDGLASLEYHERITEFVRNSTRHWISDSSTVLDFRPLYAINIHHLQRQLAQEIRNITEKHATDKQLDKIQKLLNQYTSALRDFEFIHSNRWNTVFVKDIAASRIDNGPGSRLQAALIAELDLTLPGPQQTLYSDEDLLGSFDHSLMAHRVTPRVMTRGTRRQHSQLLDTQRSKTKMAWRRFAAAMLGGFALVTPVLIIVIGTSNVSVRALVVVSISIFLFASGVALFSNDLPENLLAATAAYAAVLVVFISSTGCPSNP